MHPPSILLTATVRALHGASDPHVIEPALCNPRLACVLALAPDVHPVISALGALTSGLPELLSPTMRDSPVLSAAVASLIGTNAGRLIISRWASVTSAGWGASHAVALIDAVQRDRCPRWAAAALIGPCDASAALLTWSNDIARAVRRWGEATPDAPTAWMDALSPAERDRLVNALCTDLSDAASCLPWLPKDHATMCAVNIDAPFLTSAFDSYAGASPVARDCHVDILSSLMYRAERNNLDALTRLAAASHMDAAWTAVAQILRTAPNHADRVVAAAPWDALHPDVQTIILSATESNDVCAAIAFARGVREQPPPTTGTAARAFFAAVTPAVWSTLPAETQQAWCRALGMTDVHLAVRSLGLDPMFLAHARLDTHMIAAVRSHTRDADAVRRTLLPVAMRDLPLAAVPIITAALPVPPNPVAFVQIAGRMPKMSPALHDWIATHPTAQAAVAATTALRVAAQLIDDNIDARCAALAEAFAGWSSEEATELLAALPDNMRIALSPHPDIMTRRLARPKRQNSFRQALDALAALPPSAALPALYALDVLALLAFTSDRNQQRQVGACLAQALRAHGRRFLEIVDTLTDAQRKAILPRPQSAPHAAAVRAIAAADPLVAHRLAHALHSLSPTAALDALTEAPFDALARIWRLLPEDLQQSALGDIDALLADIAAPGCAEALARTLRDGNADDPLPLLALRMLIDNNPDWRAWGISALARHPDLMPSLLPLLRNDLQTTLASNPTIGFASADMPPSRPSASMRRRRR